MEYRLNYHKLTQDREGNDELFIDVVVKDDAELGNWCFGKWIRGADLEAYKAKKTENTKATLLDGFIAEKYLGEERTRKLEEKAYLEANPPSEMDE